MSYGLDLIREMAHSPIRNYIVPGLTSSLIGNPSERGLVRLFEASRRQSNQITPHSHRYDFRCLVLSGSVTNRVWTRVKPQHHGAWADSYQESVLAYQGETGRYEKVAGEVGKWEFLDTKYEEGQWYAMDANEVHSIVFSRDAVVLFFEGPTTTDVSIVLEPFVDGQVIETLKTEPWMFQREKGNEQGA